MPSLIRIAVLAAAATLVVVALGLARKAHIDGHAHVLVALSLLEPSAAGDPAANAALAAAACERAIAAWVPFDPTATTAVAILDRSTRLLAQAGRRSEAIQSIERAVAEMDRKAWLMVPLAAERRDLLDLRTTLAETAVAAAERDEPGLAPVVGP